MENANVPHNLIEPDTGIVHISFDGEYTLCGYAYDAPATVDVTFDGERPNMCATEKHCNCKDCLDVAKRALPILRHELKQEKKGGNDEIK